ncbi:MAG: DUF4367 domain-containing protein [Eubacteriaceae bacterium]|nr:DUF4367 domain-containing protein [Eubacteriaceae bacterium]
MNNNFDVALKHALTNEFCWLDDFENPYAEYAFSPQFETSMNAIILKAENNYISVGKRRIRKTLLVAIIALLALVITGCAVAVHYIVEWNEEQNDAQGTLDVVFQLDGENSSHSNNITLPKTPDGYTITEKYDDELSCTMVYSDPEGNQIIYSHYNNIENLSTSIDNEDATFEEATINGSKGYTYSKEGVNALYWASGHYFYELQGTCDMNILWKMAESMIDSR